MDKLEKVLVVNDQMDGLPEALGKAALLEHYSGCSVEVAETLWDSVEEEPLPQPDKANLIAAFVAAERKGLMDLLEPYEELIADSEARVLWAKQADDAILREIRAQGIDLLVKPARKSSLQDQLHAPLDWRLIREAPCAVLMSKTPEWHTGGNVLAAVDATHPDHADLNTEIIKTSQILARLLNAKLHVMSVYPDLVHSSGELQVALDQSRLRAQMREAREDALRALIENVADVDCEIHALAGKPARVIATLAEDLDATVTVLGTHARAGLKKLVLGNTVESTLPHIPGDVVTLRLA